MKKINLQKCYLFSIITLFILSLLLISFRKIYGDTDFFWHLKLGQIAWENKEWLTKEIFSLTRTNVDWFNNTQVFDVSTWLIYKNFSYLGLFITRFIFYLLTFFFVYKIVAYKNKNWKIISFVFFFILSLLLYRSLFRPEILAYFYTILYLYLLYTYKYTNKKLLYLIPLIQILWVNTHLSFVTGPALVGIFLGGEFIRHLFKHKNLNLFKNKHFTIYLLIFCLSLLASFVSPYGFKTISWFWWIYSSQESLRNIGEWQNPPNNLIFSFNNLYNLPYLIIIWTSIYLLSKKIHHIIQGKIRLLKKYSELPWEDIFLLILFLYQSLVAVRFTMITTMIAGIILIKNFPSKIKVMWLVNLLPILSIIFFLLNLYNLPQNTFGLGYLENTYPDMAVKFIRDNKIAGNVLNDYNGGGYLIWALYPEKKIFIDSRTPNVYDDDFYWRWRNVANENIKKQLLEKYQVNFWLWPNDDQISPILWQSTEWKLIYFDNTYIIYIKNTPENKEIIDKFAYQFFKPNFKKEEIISTCSEENIKNSPEIKNKFIQELEKGLMLNPDSWLHYKNLALVYQNCQSDPRDLPKIETYLLKALEINPHDSELHYYLGFNYLKMEKNELALKEFKKKELKQIRNLNPDILIGLGTAQYNLQQHRPALKTLIKAGELSNNLDSKYYQTLGRVYYMLDNNKKAIESFHRYLDLTNNYSAETYTDLTQAYFYDGQIEESKKYLQKALELDPKYPTALEMQKIIN